MRFFCSHLLFLIVLYSCASGFRDEQTEIVAKFQQQDFVNGLSDLEKSNIKAKKKNELLYLMEKGTLLFYKKDFYQAARVFTSANELVDKLYTKSVREQIASSIINDNSKTFYGSIFERSLLYYYQAMSFFKLSEQGFYIDKDGVKVELTSLETEGYLASSRSTLLAWDTFFKDLKRSSNFKSILQEDLLSKSLAGKIHEQMGTRRDREIALQLYKDALGILNRFGPAYSVFNKNYIKYNKALTSVLKGKKKSKYLKSSKTDKTTAFIAHQKFLENKILRLSQKLRPREYRRLSKKLRRKAPKFKNNRVEVVLEMDYINRLQSKNFAFNLNTALSNISDPTTRAVVEGIGVPVLTYFALGNLGLGYVSRVDNVSIYSSHNAGIELTKELGIEFKLPFLAPPKGAKDLVINVLDNKQKVVASKKVVILSSFDDLAYINSQEMIEASFTKRSLRVGLKYVAAIVAAYGTYQQLAKKNGDFLARAFALTQFLASTKLISATEEADARHWATLPAAIGQVEFDLPAGKYEIQVVDSATPSNGDGKNTPSSLVVGSLDVNSNHKSLFTYRQF